MTYYYIYPADGYNIFYFNHPVSRSFAYSVMQTHTGPVLPLPLPQSTVPVDAPLPSPSFSAREISILPREQESIGEPSQSVESSSQPTRVSKKRKRDELETLASPRAE